jgi:L-alanine-DL-glutamate epimerase-like enolase superfamily enzyme
VSISQIESCADLRYTRFMKSSRRRFAKQLALGAGAFAALPASTSAKDSKPNDQALEQAAARPVLKRELFKEPVIIESVELLRKGHEYFVRVRAKGGAEGISVDNGRADVLHPVLNRLIAPYFVGKDARDLEELLFGVYRERDNYKYQGLALWCCVALMEFAILDLLGRIASKPIGELMGKVVRTEVPFYVASGRRDTTPSQEIDYLKHLITETGAKAVKYRVGGRMNRNVDAMPGRTETLIPLTRKELGDKMVLHADSNSSYDPPQAIKVGRLLEDIGAAFYEEPCPFDNFDATKKVHDALKIPIALGEQESSEWRFQYTIKNRVADIMQPDLFYYGGLIRSMRVARMAALRDMPCTAHLSGGFGFVYMLHFASCVPNSGPWQEYKEGVKQYGSWFSPALRIIDGALTVPKGPGVGISDPKELLKGAELIPA